MLKLIHQWHSEGRTILAVIHGMQLILKHFPETILLNHGVPIRGKTDKVLSSFPISPINNF